MLSVLHSNSDRHRGLPTETPDSPLRWDRRAPIGARAHPLAEKTFRAIRDGGVYIPVRGWGDKPSERGIKIKPVLVHEVLERTEWLEQLRDLVAAAPIKLHVAGEYAPDQTADAQAALAAGGLRGRPVILF
jgi:NADPH2:quinone reductase